ncbi:hypothetical protein CJ467_19770 [Bacillus velezensis]|nr:hypothetical protein CJ467_19770 [Bacillus velezensis]
MVLSINKELKKMGEIPKELNIPDWGILNLFKAKKVDKLSYSELSKRRRAKDFDLLYDLHFNKKMSLKEIGRKYNYSPPYIRQVFKYQGIEHLAFKNQNKN